MIRTLLVDDEPYIRQGLAILIDWAAEGFEITGEAANGIEALNKIKQEEYDFIMLDIKMPEMDGMELIQTIREQELTDASIVLLTGYSEFDYARKAIHYSVLDYILKPIQKEELLKLLRIVRENVMQKQEEDITQKNMERILFERNISSLLWGKYDDINLQFVKKRLPFTGKYRYINIEVDAYRENFIGLSEELKRTQQRKLYEACNAFLGDDQYRCIFDVNKNENSYDVGFIYSEILADLKGLLESEYIDEFRKAIQRAIDFSVSFHVGQEVSDISQIGISYKTAGVAKTLQVFSDSTSQSVSYYEEPTAQQNSNWSTIKEQIDKLVHAIEENETSAVDIYTNEFYENLRISNMDYQMINLNVNYLLYRLLLLAKAQDEDVEQEEVLKVISQGAFDQVAVRGSLNHFKRFIGDYTDYLNQLRQNRSRGVLAYVEKEVELHYKDNISLKELSEKYYINSAYLGQLFRKQFGQSFKDYLNNYRIDRAAELLMRTDEKIYIIAEKVGYKNLDYFINKFVSVKGKTPLQYRKQFLE